MNYESIANGEKRVFPYYKGKFLGVTDLGYANKKSAQKFMTQIPDADVYEKLGGEEHYKRTHGYLCALNSKPFKHFLLRDEIQEGFYDYDSYHKVFLKDLPPSKQEKIWNKLVVDGLSSRYITCGMNTPKKALNSKKNSIFFLIFLLIGMILIR